LISPLRAKQFVQTDKQANVKTSKPAFLRIATGRTNIPWGSPPYPRHNGSIRYDIYITMCRVSTIGLHRLCRFFSPRFHRLIRHVEQFGSIDSHIKAVALVSIWISPRDFHCQFRKSSTDSIGAVWHGADNGVPNRCNSAPRRTIMILTRPPVNSLHRDASRFEPRIFVSTVLYV